MSRLPRWFGLIALLVGCSQKNNAKAPSPDGAPVTSAVDAGAPTTTLPADWTLSVKQIEFGVVKVELDTVTITAGGAVTIQPPAGAAPTQTTASAEALAGLKSLLESADFTTISSSRPPAEGLVYFITLGARKLEFLKPAPEIVQRVLAAVAAIARTAPGAAPPKFTVITGRTDMGGRLREHETVTVRSTGEIEVTPPGGKATVTMVPTAELGALAALLTSPDAPAMKSTKLAGEGVVRRLHIFTELGETKLSFGDGVPELADKILAEVARLRALGKPATK